MGSEITEQYVAVIDTTTAALMPTKMEKMEWQMKNIQERVRI